MIENKATLCLSISSLRGRQYVCISLLVRVYIQCVFVCVCNRNLNPATDCRHSSLHLHISRATPSLLPCPGVAGYYIKCRVPQAPAGDEFVYRKLHEKVMEKTMARLTRAETDGVQMTCSLKWKASITEWTQYHPAQSCAIHIHTVDTL